MLGPTDTRVDIVTNIVPRKILSVLIYQDIIDIRNLKETEHIKNEVKIGCIQYL